MGEDLFAGAALFCHFVCAELAESDEVSETFTIKGEGAVFDLKGKTLGGEVEHGTKLGGRYFLTADADGFYEAMLACFCDAEPIGGGIGELYIVIDFAEFFLELLGGEGGF